MVIVQEGWAHMSEGAFSHAATQMVSHFIMTKVCISSYKGTSLQQRLFLKISKAT